MAVVGRCSSFCTRPNSGHSLRLSSPSGRLSGKIPLSGNLAALLFKVEKFGASSTDASFEPMMIQNMFLGCKLLHPGQNDFLKSEESCGNNQVPLVYNKSVENISSSSGMMGILQLRYPAKAFLVTNALMLTTPFEALAETCKANNSFFNMPLLLFVALIGATVGGLLARQRKGELARLNEQLRQINASLRRQAKIESYAPNLSYAPVGARIQENEVIVDPRKEELISRLKTGKNFLRNQDLEKAFVEFKTALELAQNLKDPIKEKKAARGLGASLQRQSKYREAIKYHSMVLAISEREGENSGNAEAYGAIADCYTELGDLEQAGKFYDKYIARLETD